MTQNPFASEFPLLLVSAIAVHYVQVLAYGVSHIRCFETEVVCVVEDVETPKEEVDKKLPDEDNALLTSYMESLN